MFYSVKWYFVALWSGASLPSHQEWLQTHYSLKDWSLGPKCYLSECVEWICMSEILFCVYQSPDLYTLASSCFSVLAAHWHACGLISLHWPHKASSHCTVSYLESYPSSFCFFVKRSQLISPFLKSITSVHPLLCSFFNEGYIFRGRLSFPNCTQHLLISRKVKTRSS